MFSFGGGQADKDAKRAAKGMSTVAPRREVHLVIVALIMFVICIGGIWSVINPIRQTLNRMRDPQHRLPASLVHPPLTPMAPLQLTKLPHLPDLAAVTDESGTVASMLSQGRVPMLIGGIDAEAMAWIDHLQHADKALPPIPQSVGADDLVQKHVRPGSAVLISGRLDDAHAAGAEGTPWHWMSLALDHQQYAMVLSDQPGATAVLGIKVQINGHFLGLADLPTAVGGTELVPVIYARSVSKYVPNDSLRPILGDSMAQFHQGMFVIPADVYASISDERNLIETRPYYYTLGEVERESSNPAAYAHAPDVATSFDAVHDDPGAARGRIFEVTGEVFYAGVDDQVAIDQPFNVDRVVRVIIGRADWDSHYRQIDGKGVAHYSRMLVSRLFEVAIIGDQPVPAVGSDIRVTGRFLKFRAIPVAPDPLRDQKNGVSRNSDTDYAFFMVAPSYTIIPPPPPESHALSGTIGVGLMLLATLAVMYFLFRDRRSAEHNRDLVIRIRQARLAQQASAAHGKPDGAGPVPAAGPEAPAGGGGGLVPTPSPPPGDIPGSPA